MPLHLITANDPAILLEHAAAGFLERRVGTTAAPFPTPPYLLVLRQGGMRDDLFRLAARLGVPGWFDPPLCVLAELPARLGGGGRQPLTAAERQVLLTRAMRAAGGPVFAHGRRSEDHLDAVERLVGELCAAGVAPAHFAAALAGGGGEPRDGFERDDFERDRDAGLAAVYAAYHAALDAAGRRDGRDALVHCARFVAAHPDELAANLGGRREIRLVGLQDLRGGWHALLGALAASPALDRVVVYSAVELELGALDAVVERLAEPESIAARLFAANVPARLPREVHGIAAPDASREVEEVARRARELCDAGVPPHRIAIVARKARPHLDLAVEALARVGVPATARRRHALAGIPAVRAVLVLLDAAAAGWTRHAMVEVAEQPYLDSGLDVHVVNTIGYRRQVRGLAAWADAVAALRAEVERRECGVEPEPDGWARRVPLPTLQRVDAARDALAAFVNRARDLDRERSLGDWLDWLLAVTHEDSWGIERLLHRLPAPGRVDVARLDLAGWRALRAAAADWLLAVQGFGGGDDRLDAGRFAARLRRMLDGDVALWSETGHGVQVEEGPAAACRAFDHVFVVGLESGTFPSPAPRSALLTDVERERLVAAGLPIDPPDAWEPRERELFRVICAGAGARLTLAWSSVDQGGREVVRSSFVDDMADVATLVVEDVPLSRVLTPGVPLCATAAVASHAHRMAVIERGRQAGELSPWNGEIQDPELRRWIAGEFGDDRIWSPTQLEHYAKCGWSYFGERMLRLETRDEPDDSLEPSVRGSILHRALERFYDMARRERGGTPVLLREDDGPKALRDLLRELDVAIAEFELAGTWLGAPALRAALRDELARILRAYLAFELDWNRKLFGNRGNNPAVLRTGVVAHEVRFDDVTLNADGVRVRFRGSIDRVEHGVDERIDGADRYVAAVDYKTSTFAMPGGGDRAAWDDGVVLQVPIYARVLAELYPGAEVSRIEYRSLKSPSVKLALQLYQVSKLPAATENEADCETMAGAMTAIGRHVTKVRAGRFPAAPAPSCGCPSYCPSIDVCRVAGGPQRKEW